MASKQDVETFFRRPDFSEVDGRAASTQEDAISHEDTDSDEGMFSFARPATSAQHQFAFHQASPSEAVRPAPPSVDSEPSPFAFEPSNSTILPHVSPSDRTATAVDRQPALSPAAAYALENYGDYSKPRTRTSSPALDVDSPSSGYPYFYGQQQEEEEDPRPASSRSSRDKFDSHANWAEQPNLTYALTQDGQAIMLSELGEPVRLATTREQKVLGDLGTGSFVPYRAETEFEEEEDSPFPEVRASVSNIDDPEMPALTFRVWSLGLFFCIIVAALNSFFALRYPAPLISPILTQILCYPLGRILARFLPITNFRLPRIGGRFGLPTDFSFNPGPFNIKEHTLIVMMANVSTAPASGISLSLASEKYYGLKHGFGFDILLVLTSQMVGFGAAGLCRRFLVWPGAMIWPQNLVFCTLLNTLHAEDEDEGQGISRIKFFVLAFIGAFAWYWLPGFLFTALSAFSWVCWIAPNNIVVNQLFGVSSGLGMGLFTFDWSQIAYLGSPLVVPWWAEVNVFCGFALAFWVIAPIMYYTNVWDSAYLPISSSQVFDRFGLPYNTTAVVDAVKLTLNETAYREYSPLYLPITYATVYGLAFMLSTSVIVHTVLYHGKMVSAQLRRVKIEDRDVHEKLMRNYPEVPDWWYLAFLALATTLSIVTVACFDTRTPVWAVILATLVGFIYMIPIGIVFAMTSTSVSINLIVELIAGYALPGRPLANMLFKVYSTQTVSGGLTFVQDLKLGHYMKIPPRATFAVQIVSTSLTSLVQVGVTRWLVGRVPDLCQARQSFLLTCPTARVYYSTSVFWGLIGPARQFASKDMYNPILYWLLAGAVLPVLTWIIAKRFSSSFIRFVNIPVALTGAIFMPPATGINFSSWFLVGFIFQYLLRLRKFRWWSKYNFVLSAALDSGTVSCGVIMFLALALPKNGSIALQWWGNEVYTKTLDWAGVSYKPVPPEGFGRTSW